MTAPKMILFDYGNTLVNEKDLGVAKGVEALLKYATKNKYNRSAAEVLEVFGPIGEEFGRLSRLVSQSGNLRQVEQPTFLFSPYLYEASGIEIPLSRKERDLIWWNAVYPAEPTEGILGFLDFLKKQGIRTGVISNIPFCADAMRERIDNVITNNEFEFVIASSEYMFRKPHRYIFEIALTKTDLSPEEVWFVGDNYECDVIGSRNAGMFPVWYTGENGKCHDKKEDVLTVKSWQDLMEKM